MDASVRDQRPDRRGDAAGRRRRDLHDLSAVERPRGGCQIRTSVLELQTPAPAQSPIVLRSNQPRPCHLRDDAVSCSPRRRAGRHQRQHRTSRLARPRRRSVAGLHDDGGTSRCERFGDRRRCRRRVCDSRFPGCLRCRDRHAALEILHGAGSGRSRARDMGKRCVAYRGWTDLGHRKLRSGA